MIIRARAARSVQEHARNGARPRHQTQRYFESVGGAERALCALKEISKLADDKLYKAEYQGSGTFIISKPKRKSHKARQTKVKNPQRGARK